MGTFILIIIMATSGGYSTAGSASLSQEFSSYTACKVAGDNIAKQLTDSRTRVFSIGCYQK